MKGTSTSAFPVSGLSGLPNDDFIQGREGMALYNYFAVKALQGILAAPNVDCIGAKQRSHLAKSSFELADAKMEARK